MEVRDKLKNGFVILDGAMGTMLQKAGLALGERPELLCLSHPEAIEEIHRAYLQNGAEVIYTNTFGANAHKLEGAGVTPARVIPAAVAIAKRACRGGSGLVALDLGPIGELLEPAGTLRFEEAYELFREQAVLGEQAGADLVVIETMTDLYEAKAALLAVRENTKLPVLVSMTFEKNMRTFTGCSVDAMALTLEGLGADAIGINCSLGPAEIFPIAQRLCQCTRLPVLVKANAGLPDPSTGGYDVTPQQFAAEVARYVQAGVTLFGGCCGTTPEYIAAIREQLEQHTPKKRKQLRRSAICTPTRTVVVDGVHVIGERINPTGKKRFQQALREQDFDYVLAQGITQVEAGAEILDVNVGLPGIDEAATMERVIKLLQSVVDVPLQIDSSKPQAIAAALRVYNGKAIVNSVNGEKKSLETILPLVKRYGAAIVGLTLDENGIPPKAEQRLAIAERILKAALSYGIAREDVYIDCLTLTASAQQAEVVETLRAVQMVKQRLGLQTVLGVSNISFGLPNRELINHSFLLLALAHGLTLPILNPNIEAMMDAVRAYRVLYNQDQNASEYIACFSGVQKEEPTAPQPQGEQDIAKAIMRGLKEDARTITKALLQHAQPIDLVNQRLIPALDDVGAQYEKGEIFLPQLLQAAQAAQAAFDVVKEAISSQGSAGIAKGKIVIATVKGDIHDIGKNIVKVILENYGYQMIDLGRDVPIEAVVEAVQRHNARLVGLSALMTTTLASMEQTIQALHEAGLPCKIFVGGAVLTPEYAEKMGADFYAKDAKQSVDIAKQVLG